MALTPVLENQKNDWFLLEEAVKSFKSREIEKYSLSSF